MMKRKPPAAMLVSQREVDSTLGFNRMRVTAECDYEPSSTSIFASLAASRNFINARTSS
ncbi:hypothetical protein Rcae01_05307 [Novipirellula caenicola]|uniref:Uncharacterized protein n=1 Tax=Novipirellula caenicola TaxID=1536901 RepID=A0ABP9VXE0_9BACT